jgi:hypothetical protein
MISMRIDVPHSSLKKRKPFEVCCINAVESASAGECLSGSRNTRLALTTMSLLPADHIQDMASRKLDIRHSSGLFPYLPG